MASKKDSKSESAKPPRNGVKTLPAKRPETMAELRRQLAESAKELHDCKRQLAEAMEHQGREVTIGWRPEHTVAVAENGGEREEGSE